MRIDTEEQAAKAPVSITPVAEGIVRVELYFSAPPGSVNVFLVRDGQGWLAIDVGPSDDGTLRSWDAIHASGIMEGLPITRVLVTHSHYDHLGLAGELCRRTGAPLLMSRSEWLIAKSREQKPTLYRDAKQPQFLAAGMPADVVHRILEHENIHQAVTATLPPEFKEIRDGDTLQIGGERWNVLFAGGHSPAQVCLHHPGKKLVFSVDQVLRQLPTFVPPDWLDPLRDPVDDFLASLGRLKALPADTLVVPSHGKPFSGLHARIAGLESNHRTRCSEILRLCEQPRSGMDILAVLFPAPASDDWLVFALEETIAYLEHLVRLGLLRDFWRSGLRFFIRENSSAPDRSSTPGPGN